MRPFVLLHTVRDGIKAPFVLPAAGHEVPCSKARRALNVEWPPLEVEQPKNEYNRRNGDGHGLTEAIVLRLQKSRKAKQPVKAVAGQLLGRLSGPARHEKPEGLEQSKRSKTKSTGAAF
jgi:hypothetical protein